MECSILCNTFATCTLVQAGNAYVTKQSVYFEKDCMHCVMQGFNCSTQSLSKLPFDFVDHVMYQPSG